jgi:hypothetical protein
MEILIIGGIIVALMVYASTKIKNQAKAAYQREVFETEHFKLIKPDDFIVPIKENSEFLFEAFSKELSENDESEDYYRCRATIQEKDGLTDETDAFESEQIENNVTLKIFRKALAHKELDKTFELKIFLIPDYEEQFLEGINVMLNSFQLK